MLLIDSWTVVDGFVSDTKCHFQCIQQESDPHHYDDLTDKMEKGRRGNLTGQCLDYIVEWASLTIEFTSIVVLFEVSRLFPGFTSFQKPNLYLYIVVIDR